MKKRARHELDSRVRTSGSSEVVSDALKAYADRGVFRGFSERAGRGGRREFRFLWLTNRPIEVSYDATTATLTFRNLLTGIKPAAALFLDLRRFLARFSTREVPAHRGIDPARAQVRVVNRGGAVSICVKAKPRHQSYMANRAVHLVHELFLWLQESHAQYLWDEFDAPRD